MSVTVLLFTDLLVSRDTGNDSRFSFLGYPKRSDFVSSLIRPYFGHPKVVSTISAGKTVKNMCDGICQKLSYTNNGYHRARPQPSYMHDG